MLTWLQDKTATTYVITCASGTRSTAASATSSLSSGSSQGRDDEFEECGLGLEPLTMTQGPSTLHVENSIGGYAQTLDCVLDGTTSATCTASQPNMNDVISTMTDFTESFESIPTAITTTLRGSMVEFQPVTITAGASKGGATASATKAGATASPAAGSAFGTGATKTGGASTQATDASTTASQANQASPSSTTGAAPINVASAYGGGLMALAVGMVAAML